MIPERPVNFHVLLAHLSEPHVLLLPDTAGLTVPHWQPTDREYWQTVHGVNRAMRERFGLAVTTLRCLCLDDGGATYRGIWYECESHESLQLPPGAQWAGRDTLPSVHAPAQRGILDAWFAETEVGLPPMRRPWTRRGWLAEATAWIEEQLTQLGLHPTGPSEQIRTWERSIVLRVPISTGDLYFKALPAMFAHEIPLIDLLAAQFPHNTVRVLASDPVRHWLLMADMGGRLLHDVPEIERWEGALRRFAQIQIATATQHTQLLAIGCLDRPLAALADQIDPFFAELECYPGLSSEQIAALHSLVPAIKRQCADLAAYALPMALEHGDFSPSNIMVTGQDAIPFDWSDCSIAHPFFSICAFLADDVLPELPRVPHAMERIRNAYLEPWTAYETHERLLAAYGLAHAPAMVHLALGYHDTILPQMEARWEMENMVAFYLRLLLDAWPR